MTNTIKQNKKLNNQVCVHMRDKLTPYKFSSSKYF